MFRFHKQVSKIQQRTCSPFDNGEISQEELTMRQCATLASSYSSFRDRVMEKEPEDFVNRVRKVWNEIKTLNSFIIMLQASIDEMTNVIRRFFSILVEAIR